MADVTRIVGEHCLGAESVEGEQPYRRKVATLPITISAAASRAARAPLMVTRLVPPEGDS